MRLLRRQVVTPAERRHDRWVNPSPARALVVVVVLLAIARAVPSLLAWVCR